MPLDTTKAIILPQKEGLKTTDAASLPLVFLTAYTTLVYYANLQDPPRGAQKRNLVLGGSTGLGIMHCDSSKRLNSHIVTTASSRNSDVVKSLSANEVIDYTSTSVLNGALKHLRRRRICCHHRLVGGMKLLPHLNTLLKSDAAYVTQAIVGDKTARNKSGAFLYIPRRSTSEVSSSVIY